MKYLSYIISGLTILGMLIGGVSKFNAIENDNKISKEKVAVLEKKIEEVEKENNKLDKSLGEFSVEQRVIKDNVSEIKSDIKELIKELKK